MIGQQGTSRHYFSVLFVCFIGIVVLAAGYRYVQMHDYDMYFHAPCDSETESCFIAEYECEEGEEGMCTDAYKMLILPASALDACTPDDGECLLEVCAADSAACAAYTCNPETQAYLGIDDECSSI